MPENFHHVEMTPLATEDERAIEGVLIRYATGIDRRDWPLFKSCFTEDFEGDYGPTKCWSGASEITDYMIERHVDVGLTLHRITNIAIAASADGATARSYVDAILMPGDGIGAPLQAIGYYDDELIKASGTWRIRRRKFTLVRLLAPGT